MATKMLYVLFAVTYLMFSTGGYIASTTFQKDATIVHVINGFLWPLHAGHALTRQSFDFFKDVSL
jgi:hypothetical protein